jgi:DNA-binding transcriptional LysR family regulator
VQYFLKVADCLSFSQAAEALYVSQPSVSRQVQQLEHELGYPLFDRARKNDIALTAAGVVFRDHFRRCSQGFEAAQAAAREVAGAKGISLRMGIGQGWDLSDQLLEVRELVRQSFPQAKLTFESNTFLHLRNQVESDQLDAILCTETSVQHFGGLEIVQVGRLESRAYVRRGLLRDEDETLRLSDFQGHTLLMLPEEEAPMSLQIIQLQFQARHIEVAPKRLPNRDSIYQALLLGEGFSVFDQHMAFRDDPRLTWCHMEDLIPICMVWKKRDQNPLLPIVAEELRSRWKAEPGQKETSVRGQSGSVE